MTTNYYWTDISISITRIKAKSKAEAEALVNEFLNKIAAIKTNEIQWDDANWIIQEDTYDKTKGEWVTLEVNQDKGTCPACGYLVCSADCPI